VERHLGPDSEIAPTFRLSPWPASLPAKGLTLVRRPTPRLAILPRESALSKALADAARWGLVGRNAARLADVPTVARPKLRMWSPEQTRAFLAAVANDRLFDAWLLAAHHRHAPRRAARPSLGGC